MAVSHISHQASKSRHRQSNRKCTIGKLSMFPLKHIEEKKYKPRQQASNKVREKPRKSEFLLRVQPVKLDLSAVFENKYSLGEGTQTSLFVGQEQVTALLVSPVEERVGGFVEAVVEFARGDWAVWWLVSDGSGFVVVEVVVEWREADHFGVA